jgi:peroxiredoxin
MMELEALQEIDSEVRVLGARILALTPELERYTRSVHKKLNLTFDILTDLHLKTAEQFRLVFVLPDYLRDLYRSFGNTLDRFHDESEYRLPMPARYVIDTEGIIRAADVNADYTIVLSRPKLSGSCAPLFLDWATTDANGRARSHCRSHISEITADCELARTLQQR